MRQWHFEKFQKIMNSDREFTKFECQSCTKTFLSERVFKRHKCMTKDRDLPSRNIEQRNMFKDCESNDERENPTAKNTIFKDEVTKMIQRKISPVLQFIDEIRKSSLR